MISLTIIAVCVAGLWAIASWRMGQAHALGAPYWDPARKWLVIVAGAVLLTGLALIAGFGLAGP